MCDFTNGIKLCTCSENEIKFREQEFHKKIKGEYVIIPNKANDTIPLEFIWTLFKFDRDIETTEMGRYMMPSNDIGNGLNSEWIALNLNCEDCFDFDYKPKEGDNLKIHQNVILSP